MRARTLGRTGLQVSEIGFGAWGIGKSWWGTTDDEESLKSLRLAMDHGVDFFDTAYIYGDGHSERMIGQAFKDAGKRKLVATKVPPKNMQWPSAGTLAEAFPAEWVVSCTERSLKNLGVEQVDLQQLHVWRDAWLAEPAWEKTWAAIERLKKDGKIRSFGVSIDDRAPASALEIVRGGFVDAVQVIFNLFEQEPAEKLFPLCRDKNVGVLARVPLDEGGLSGKLAETTVFEKSDFRSTYFAGGLLKETVRRAQALERTLVGKDTPDLPSAALRFILSFPEVSTVIPGMRQSRHVEANVKVAGCAPYPPTLLKELKAHAWRGR